MTTLSHSSVKILFHSLMGVNTESLDSVVENANMMSPTTLLIFDDSCEEILESPSFVNLATAGRHKRLHAIFIKHNMYQQGKYSVTVDKNTTHIVLMKSPRIGKQLKLLGQELDNVNSGFLPESYKRATREKFGHLLVDLSPDCSEFLRYCTNITGNAKTGEPTTFYLSSQLARDASELSDDKRTNCVYAETFSQVQSVTKANISFSL